MCGICGELRFDSRPASAQIVERMSAKLALRGPDHEGTFVDGSIALGHRRLAVIDLSANANQPMRDEQLSLVLVFNGTIYNYRELKSELEKLGYTFFSKSDTEVIIKAYHAWGEKCVERLDGMFAFALWDQKKQSLFLARDRLGIKPLYYSKDKTSIRFASTLQALLASTGNSSSGTASNNIDTSIDPVALHHHFTLHGVVPAPRTLLKGVRKIVPGTTHTISMTGYSSERKYWTLQASRPKQSKLELVWKNEIYNALVAAIDKRLNIADVPVGILLSGGLDSSLLVGLLANSGVSDIRTFSIGFEDTPEEKGNEFYYSDQIVDRFHTQHKKIIIPNSEVLNRLPEAVMNMAEPMVGQDAIAFYLLAEQVSKEIKVVQSGQGADEVFGGYFWYSRMLAESGSDIERFRNHYFDRTHVEYLQTVQETFQGNDVTSTLIADLLAESTGETFMDRVFHLDVTTLIVDDPVKRVDNMTMAWGLEARVPFLDQQLVELAAQMPEELKLKQNGKYILKSIAKEILPSSVVDRSKGYFPMPALKYIHGSFLQFMKDVLNSDACRTRGILQRRYIDKLIDAPDRHMTLLYGNKLWHCALLEYWLQLNVD